MHLHSLHLQLNMEAKSVAGGEEVLNNPPSDPAPSTTIEPLPGEPTTIKPLPAEPTTIEPLPTEPTTIEPLPAETTTTEPLPAEPNTIEPLPAAEDTSTTVPPSDVLFIPIGGEKVNKDNNRSGRGRISSGGGGKTHEGEESEDS
ncbi:hypothetical protein HanRHA438_Chr02g0067691 [Helianthus annuus]|uniref:Uncharacterized protein n=1 Tax=Helianthus annuus TaxID=4232 RepID=A0A251VEX9_HELAN|nr:salivary glue protein Sgs-3 [Helianthus annuus]KAF5818545.1 hypothetical protein HanXRQr2_Chr02g0066551 [Helianthus annuus]KAJ0604811.1 hypothetical protein HanHA300_Chr02g0054501 [Helianthus annuus]KAJ0618827.1 hypothetical protein HanHA89_Chr02g0057991 [Helianthus annuus]KAJ0777283.1 hypothetical protein HanLR1_Chr02g0055601 [Helianthus annuus]KAJ0940001.1 hypothetical protein HanRHA438_Chr02g0067691 [Helianthus annuus]